MDDQPDSPDPFTFESTVGDVGGLGEMDRAASDLDAPFSDEIFEVEDRQDLPADPFDVREHRRRCGGLGEMDRAASDLDAPFSDEIFELEDGQDLLDDS